MLELKQIVGTWWFCTALGDSQAVPMLGEGKGRETCLYHCCTCAISGLLVLWGLGLLAVPKLKVSSSSSTVHIPQRCSFPIAWRMLCT